ncbi:MAG: universal stress protein [Cellvibrionaceae bacterium]
MIKTILLATDLSVFTPCVLQHASELAKQHNAKLVVVHAIEPLGTLGHALLHAYLNPKTTQQLTTTGLDAMVQEVKAQVIDALTDEYMEGDVDLLKLGEVIVKTGTPVDVILQAAEDVQADLIVLGSHSPDPHNLSHIGTVAQKVLNNAKVPVYVVPNRAAIWQQEGGSQSQMGLW